MSSQGTLDVAPSPTTRRDSQLESSVTVEETERSSPSSPFVAPRVDENVGTITSLPLNDVPVNRSNTAERSRTTTHQHVLRSQSRIFADSEHDTRARKIDWTIYTISFALLLAINLPLLILSLQDLSRAPLYELKDIYIAVGTTKGLYAAGAITEQEYMLALADSQKDITFVQNQSKQIWIYALISFFTCVTITLICAGFVYVGRKEPDIRALGKYFFIQFFVGTVIDDIFDLLYVGVSLLQIIKAYPPPIIQIRDMSFAMLACRTILGSTCYSCFAMRQRVIYYSFNRLSGNLKRVYVNAFIFFILVAIIGIIPLAVTTFVPSQYGANYRFAGVYFQWLCYTIPFYFWTFKTPHASRRFNDFHSNIRVHLTISACTLTVIIYSTVYPESLLSLIGMGYSIRFATTVYAVEAAGKAIASKYNLIKRDEKKRPSSQLTQSQQHQSQSRDAESRSAMLSSKSKLQSQKHSKVVQELPLNEADETGVNVLAINPESHDMLAPGLLPSAEDTVKSDKSEHTLTECVVESQS